MADPFLGEIKMVGFTFAPRNWAFCNGQLLSIAQNTALFSLLGTTYGGNGQTTFALPNLQGRTPIQAGQGPGLSPYNLGQVGGEATHTLIAAEAGHTHVLKASANQGSTTAPAGNVLASKRRGGKDIYHPAANVTLEASSVSGVSGGGGPHNNMQPYLGINFVIALAGIFPSRN
jgi:microcystin-dependent protein